MYPWFLNWAEPKQTAVTEKGSRGGLRHRYRYSGEFVCAPASCRCAREESGSRAGCVSFNSPPRIGGVAVASRKCRGATKTPQTGWSIR
jgi:hypothetical protein